MRGHVKEEQRIVEWKEERWRWRRRRKSRGSEAIVSVESSR